MSRQGFIVKNSWRDDARQLEGEFHRKIGRVSGVTVMHSYRPVRIDGEAGTMNSSGLDCVRESSFYQSGRAKDEGASDPDVGH